MQKVGATIVSGLIAVVASGPALGRDSDAQIALNEASLQAALGQQVVPLLGRSQGPGAEWTLNTILSEFSVDLASGGYSSLQREDAEALRGDADWFLTVKEDGTAVELWNEGAMRIANQEPRPVSERLPQGQAEEVAEAFIRERLSSVVQVASDDQLEASSVRYQVQSTTDSSGQTTGEEVVAARVNFGRTKNGLRIVGGGSFVSVTLSNSGSVVGFSFDWPEYTTSSATQATIDVVTMRERAAAVGPIGAGESATLERVNCGYYDQGSEREDRSAPIQPACSIIYSTAKYTSGAYARAGYEVVVPLGSTYEPDSGWPEAARLKTPGAAANTTLLMAITPSANQE